MSTPDPSLDRVAAAITGLESGVRELVTDVKYDSDLRNTKVKWIQRVLYVMVPCLVLLLIMAFTNFAILSSARSTNQTIASCLQPNTECSNQNAQQQAAILQQIAQRQFVIAICQRETPLPPNPSPAEINAGKQKLVECVQSYYPDFRLPDKVGQ